MPLPGAARCDTPLHGVVMPYAVVLRSFYNSKRTIRPQRPYCCGSSLLMCVHGACWICDPHQPSCLTYIDLAPPRLALFCLHFTGSVCMFLVRFLSIDRSIDRSIAHKQGVFISCCCCCCCAAAAAAAAAWI